jgi:hypothetical protein
VFDAKELSRKLSLLDADTLSILGGNRTSSGQQTRRGYARIRAVHNTVLTPTTSSAPARGNPIAFKVILEPLYLGFLPASVFPVVLFLFPVVSLALMAVPYIYDFMTAVARRGQVELRHGEKEE